MRRFALYAFALSLVWYGLWTLAHEKGPVWHDFHAIIAYIGFLLIPDVPKLIAAGFKTVSTPMLEAWKARQ